MSELSKELNIAKKAAQKAGSFLLKKFDGLQEKDIHFKKYHEKVTDYDKKAEKIIKEVIFKNFPSYGFLGEEENKINNKKSSFLWIVDPLDGTTNYTLKIPFWGVSIGLAYEKKLILGVVFYPFLNQLFEATFKKGAFLNQKRISGSSKSLSLAFVSFCSRRDKNSIQKSIKIYTNLRKKVYHLRSLGSASLELSYLAWGKIDAFYNLEAKIWDVAAGAVISQEAGLKVTDFSGKPFSLDSKNILVANNKIHNKLLKNIHESF